MSFHQKNRKKNFFRDSNLSNFPLAFPLHEKNEEKPANIKNLDGTHFVTP